MPAKGDLNGTGALNLPDGRCYQGTFKGGGSHRAGSLISAAGKHYQDPLQSGGHRRQEDLRNLTGSRIMES